MKEDFLHHVWLHKRINVMQLFTTAKEKIEILNFGNYLQTSGPDFFNAQLIIGNQKWAGNIEIHVKSSDWYLHHHETDVNYNNVILHVVWEHDTPVFRNDNTEIPTLELKNYVDETELKRYLSLSTEKTWIYCENQLNFVDDFVLNNWKERLYFERLEHKAVFIETLLHNTNNDWEAACFVLIAKSFGLNVNGETFAKMAQIIPFSIIRKEQYDVENLEALFFGIIGILSSNSEDNYYKSLKTKWQYFQTKYNIQSLPSNEVQFFKLRPDNFPTIRLAQLASLYAENLHLFSLILKAKSMSEFYALFKVGVSEYWLTHYNFDAISPKKRKSISNNFIDLLLINAIFPLLYVYSEKHHLNKSDFILELLTNIKPEKNTIIDKFKQFGCQVNSAMDSQSFLQLKKEYCEKKKCLKCAIGISILKN